jgi:PTH1 family peptidyl-tRNA hydrolase
VVSALADRLGLTLSKAKRFIRADVAETRIGGRAAVIAEPRTFMNNAGQAVAPLARYYKVGIDDLLVIHDDIDLPFGKMRAQVGRGPGGHNGVSSVARSLGSRDFWRLKLGVGRPPGRQDPADFVLRRFKTKERADVDLMVQYAADLVEVFVTEGGPAARQRAGEVGRES